MTHLLINGRAISPPIDPEHPFGELLGYLRKSYNSETALISNILINGEEMSIQDENSFAKVPLEEMGQIEVFTAHPREIAEETIQALIGFCDQLSEASRSLAPLCDLNEFAPRFKKLIDGMALFNDAAAGVKRILRVGLHPPSALVEADLASTLTDIGDAYRSRNLAYLVDLLVKHLPENLSQWKSQVFPGWVRSRDS